MKENEQKKIFDGWLAEHKGLFFKVVRAHASTPQDQDDLFQEIAIQVWKSVPDFRQESAVTTWIYRVALYSALAWLRRENKHREKSESLEDSGHLLAETPSARDPRLDWLYEQIGQLDEVDRSLTLLLLDGFSYQDMADILGIGESQVGVRIHRIKKHLTERSKVGEGHAV